MRRVPTTTCIKCGKPIALSSRRQTPYEHPLQKLLKQIVPPLCETCRLRRKRPFL